MLSQAIKTPSNIESASSERIVSLDPKKISRSTLESIAYLEIDMWARESAVGEYVRCKGCGRVHSKEDVFGHLEKKVKVLTVDKIEKILGGGRPICRSCHGETEPIYEKEWYIEEVRERYRNSVNSFLTVYKDEEGEIRGFIDGYIDSYEKVFKREFEHNYGKVGPQKLKEVIEQVMGKKLPDEIFMVGALGMEEGHKSFFQLYSLMKGFFEHLDSKQLGKLFLLIEVIIGSNVHGIHNSVGISRIGIKKHVNDLKFEGNECDLFYQEDFLSLYLKKFSKTPKDFLRENSKTMRVA